VQCYSKDGDNNSTSDVYQGGRLMSETLRDAGNNVLRTTSYQYNGLTEVQTDQDGSGHTISTSTTVYDLDGNPVILAEILAQINA
jgi:hypothetical protein